MNINDLQYVHIPKTGGWSIGNILNELGYKNFYEHQFSKNIKNINDKFSFTIVRNPWSRLVSTYSFLTKGSEVHVPPEASTFKKLNISNFKEFVLYLHKINGNTNDCYILPKEKQNRINLFTLNQVNWILDDDGNSLVRYIGRLENINNSIEELSNLTKINLITPPKANVTKHNNFKTLYDDETIDLVANLYEKDIIYFNFRFDD